MSRPTRPPTVSLNPPVPPPGLLTPLCGPGARVWQGTYAKVFKARCTEAPHDGEIVAIKTLQLEAFMASLEEIIVSSPAGAGPGVVMLPRPCWPRGARSLAGAFSVL